MDVRLPKLGENAEGGAVVSILVKEGDTIAKGQTILELEDEKAVAPIPSSADGVISRIQVKEGDRVTVGQVLLTLAPSGALVPAATSPAPATAAAAPAPPPAPAPSVRRPDAASSCEQPPDAPMDAEPAGPPPAASPEIRRIARALGIDLRRVRSSERGGRVVMGDLKNYVEQLQKLAVRTTRPSATPGAPPTRPIEVIDFSKWGPVARQPLSSLRKTISRRMLENWNTIPHVTQFDEADITDLMNLRAKLAAEYEKKGARLTLTSFAIRAVVSALQKHPVFNSSLDDASQELVLKNYFHIGLAVDTDQGLIVPVIRDADRKSLFQLSQEVSALAEKARQRKVSLEELKGGTFTISNQGGIGSAHFTPIINKPEVAILGLGRGALRPVVREKKIEQRLLLPVALSYDHRVIDGGTAARFTVDLVSALQSFQEQDVKLG